MLESGGVIADRLVAIDPGPAHSAVIVMESGVVVDHFKTENSVVLEELRGLTENRYNAVIEMIASYGRPVGAETFETCVWIGRFIGATNGTAERMFRRDVTKHLCGNSHKVNDAVVRQRLIDVFSRGQGKGVAVGNKKSPGPLWGIKSDVWQALALGVTFGELKLLWKIQ